jgi:gliding motility-associated-like protein
MMKKILLLTTVAVLICFASTAQQISVRIDANDLYYTEPGCEDCNSTPDPTWNSRLWTNATNHDWTIDASDINSCGWQGMFSLSPWLPFTAMSYTSTVKMQLDGKERDTWLCGDNDNVCNGYSDVTAEFQISDDDPCQWNIYSGERTCYDDEQLIHAYGTYGIEWSIYWKYIDAPVISNEINLNQVVCESNIASVISVDINSDTHGRSLGRWYKWQISNSPNGPWSDVPNSQNTLVNTATTILFTPEEISGTRYYRITASSNCSADYSTNTSYSQVFTVTYAFVSTGAYSNAIGGYPYGNGDLAPNIISPICGSTITPNQDVVLTTLQAPASGHIANSNYDWTSTNGVITGTGNSIVWTSPSTSGTQTISLTYNQGCPSPATVDCITDVGDPLCEFVYVCSTTGSDAVSYIMGGGGPSNPFQTIAFACDQAEINNIRHIKIKNGTYNESEIIEIPDNTILEGGYYISSGSWSKSSTSTTNIIGSGFETVNQGGTNIGHIIGLKGNSANNWKLIDLNISTVNASGTTDSRGNSNYALLLTNSSNYGIVRCNITSGNGSQGSNGVTPTIGGGAAGGTGGSGGVGHEGCGNSGDGQAGTNGGTGADFGAGIANSANAGALQTSATWDNDGCCNYPRYGSNGNNGSSGVNGPSWTSGDRPVVTTAVVQYFVPGTQSEQGSHGQGGGGGSGGKASSGGEHTFICEDCEGRNGGNGGRGGDGGQGGTGGYGGGGSFAIWSLNSSTGAEITDCDITSGNSGNGGSGALGSGPDNSLINNGRSNGAYHDGCYRDNEGGDGGYGGSGGTGGRGRDGANGLSFGMVVDGAGLNPTSTIPNESEVTIKYYNNMVICKNSVLEINKSSGSGDWTLPSNFEFVKYNSEYENSQYDISSQTAEIYTLDNNIGQYNITVGSLVFSYYLDVSGQDRNIPIIEIRDMSDVVISTNTACVGSSIKLNDAIVPYGTEVDFRWEIFSGNIASDYTSFPNSNALFSSNISNPEFGSFDSPGTYLIRYQVRETCCGWSIPVFTELTIVDAPITPSATKSPEDVTVCENSLIGLTQITDNGGGTGNCNIEYRFTVDNGNNWSSWTIINPDFSASFTSEIGENTIQIRKTCDGSSCYASEIQEYTWTAVPQPEVEVAGSGTICSGLSSNISAYGLNGSNCDEFIWESSNDASTWEATALVGSNPTITPISDTYYRAVYNCNGYGCNQETSEALFIQIESTPVVDDLEDVFVCDMFELPELLNGNYYTESMGDGTAMFANDEIVDDTTIYIYSETGTATNCYSESSFDITVYETPQVDNLVDISVCDTYSLTNLTNGNYFTETMGGGTQLYVDDIITETQTVYVFNETETNPNCYSESSFIITINETPQIDAPVNVSACDLYLLPSISNGSYFTGPGGTGFGLTIGTEITASQNIYVYAETGTIPNCYSENTFLVQINNTPPVDDVEDISVCDLFVLPALVNGNYYTGPNGTGSQLQTGTEISASQTIYVFAETGTTPNCENQSEFEITINPTQTPVFNDMSSYCIGEVPDILPLQSLNGFVGTWTPNTINTNTVGIESYLFTPTELECFTSSEIDIEVNDYPDVVISLLDSILFTTEQVDISVIGADAYQWEGLNMLSCTDCSNPVFSAPDILLNDEIYSFLLTSTLNGCSVVDTVKINVLGDVEFKIPGGFSPDGDGICETWQIEGIDRLPNNLLMVYNRWGALVYEAEPYNSEWTGNNLSGEKLPAGTYYYVFKADKSLTEAYTGYVFINY